MKLPVDLEQEARNCRDLARRARRLARELSLEADRTRLINYADHLDERAAQLEQRAKAQPVIAPAPPVTHHQQQIQQQQQTEPKPDDPKPDDPKPDEPKKR